MAGFGLKEAVDLIFIALSIAVVYPFAKGQLVNVLGRKNKGVSKFVAVVLTVLVLKYSIYLVVTILFCG